MEENLSLHHFLLPIDSRPILVFLRTKKKKKKIFQRSFASNRALSLDKILKIVSYLHRLGQSSIFFFFFFFPSQEIP